MQAMIYDIAGSESEISEPCISYEAVDFSLPLLNTENLSNDRLNFLFHGQACVEKKNIAIKNLTKNKKQRLRFLMQHFQVPAVKIPQKQTAGVSP